MMSRQKVKGTKPAKRRPFFPFKGLTSSSGKGRGVDSIRNSMSIANEALNIVLAEETKLIEFNLPIAHLSKNRIASDKHNYENNVPKGMVPFHRISQAGMHCKTSMSPNPVIISSLDCSDPGSMSTIFEDNAGKANPQGIDSFPSCHTLKRTISVLDFTEPSMSPDFVNSIQDEKLSSNSMQDLGTMMAILSPDPIAPDHPLMKRLQRNKESPTSSFDDTISNTIHDLFKITPTHEQLQQEDSSMFEGRNFFTLEDRLDLRSTLFA